MSYKKFKLVSVLLVICASAVMADTTKSSSQPPKGKKGDAVLHKVYTSSAKKRSLPKAGIEVEYSDGFIIMYSDNESEYITLEISNSESGAYMVINDIWSGESQAIDLNCGRYDLTATNSEGYRYQGVLTIVHY